MAAAAVDTVVVVAADFMAAAAVVSTAAAAAAVTWAADSVADTLADLLVAEVASRDTPAVSVDALVVS
jgi:hypothetical protein